MKSPDVTIAAELGNVTRNTVIGKVHRLGLAVVVDETFNWGRREKSNSIFNVLNEKNVQRQPIGIGEPFEPRLPDGSRCGIEVLLMRPIRTAWLLVAAVLVATLFAPRVERC
jgi:hypothetical protein